MAPTIALSGDASVDEGSLYSLTLGAVTDPGDDTVTEWTVHWGDGGSNTYLADGVVTHTYADGPADYTISVDLLDEDGTHLAAGSHDVTVDNVKPTISLSGPATADEGDTETYSFVVSDPGLDTHTITVNCGANGAQVGSTAYNPLDGMGSFDCFFADGPATTNVTATVTDSDGAADTDAQLVTVTVANVAPTVTLTGAAAADEGDTVSFSYTTSDPGSEVFSLDEATCDGGTLDNDSFNSVDGSGSFDCTFDDNATYNVSVTVSDGDQTGSDTIAVIVANVAPVADAGADQTVDEGDLVSQDGSFSDAGSGDSHTFLWQVVADNGQVIADATTEDFSFTPFDNGSYSLTFTVTDDDGDSDSDTALITVDNVDPTVDAGADQSVDEGDLVSLDPATFTDAGSNDTHTASIDWGDGSSLAIGSVTQTDGLSGTVDADHTYADNGIYSVTVCVSDDDLAETCDTLEVTVANVDPTVTLTGATPVNEGDTVTYSYSLTDAGSADSFVLVLEDCDGGTPEQQR